MLILSDIHGLDPYFNNALNDEAQWLYASPQSEIESTTQPASYLSEQDQAAAYHDFLQSGGLDAYIKRAYHALKHSNQCQRVIGFSAGASVLHVLSYSDVAHHISHGMSFYGSQIRHMPSQNDVETRLARLGLQKGVPSSNTHILAEYETSYKAGDIAKVLKRAPNNHVEIVKAEHGFMRQNSTAFNPDLFSHFVAKINTNTLGKRVTFS